MLPPRVMLACAVALVLAAVSVGGGRPAECPTTYNIREYHVHAGRAWQAAADGTRSAGVPLLGSALAAGVFISKNRLYDERNKWMKRLEELQSQLVEEKRKRLAQLDELIARAGGRNGATEGAESDGGNGTGRGGAGVSDVQGDGVPWQPPPAAGRSENTVEKVDAKVDHRKTAKSKPPGGDNKGRPVARLRGRLLAVTRRLKVMSGGMSRLRKDVRDVRQRGRHVEKLCKDLSVSYEHLRSDYVHAQGRNRQLRTFHANELRRIDALAANETLRRRAEVTSLLRRVESLESAARNGGSGGGRGAADGGEGVARSPVRSQPLERRTLAPPTGSPMTTPATAGKAETGDARNVTARNNDDRSVVKIRRARSAHDKRAAMFIFTAAN